MPRLQDIFNFDVNTIIFTEPEEKKIPGQKISYHNVNLKVLNPDGTKTDLILATDRCVSWGINTDYETPSLSIQFYNREGDTEYQKKYVEVVRKITEKCVEYLNEKKKNMGFNGKFEWEKICPIKFTFTE